MEKSEGTAMLENWKWKEGNEEVVAVWGKDKH
jgi:hypothetical protein